MGEFCLRKAKNVAGEKKRIELGKAKNGKEKAKESRFLWLAPLFVGVSDWSDWSDKSDLSDLSDFAFKTTPHQTRPTSPTRPKN